MTPFGRCFLRFWYYYIVSHGSTIHAFNFQRRCMHRSRLLGAYSVGATLLTLLGLPFYYIYGVNYFALYANKPLLRIVSCGCVQLQCVAIVQHLATRRRKDRIFSALVRQLLQLEVQLFERLPQVDHGYAWLFYGKVFSLSWQSFMVVHSFIGFHQMRALTQLDLYMNLYFLCIWSIINATIFCYFLALLHISQCFRRLSAQLRLFSRADLGNHSRSCFHELLRVHGELRRMVVTLNRLFSIDIIVILLVFFMVNSSTFYLAFIFVPNWNVGSLSLVFLLFMFFVEYVDIYLLLHCCDEIVARHRETIEVLRDFSNSQQLKPTDFHGDDCEKTSDEYSLNLIVTKFSVNIRGLFDLDKRRAFAILCTTVTHTILVMQFDYILKVTKIYKRAAN